jgi:hypothetical protein
MLLRAALKGCATAVGLEAALKGCATDVGVDAARATAMVGVSTVTTVGIVVGAGHGCHGRRGGVGSAGLQACLS